MIVPNCSCTPMQLLQTELGNRAYLGELDTDSSNVVDLVEQLYNVRNLFTTYKIAISLSLLSFSFPLPSLSITLSLFLSVSSSLLPSLSLSAGDIN